MIPTLTTSKLQSKPLTIDSIYVVPIIFGFVYGLFSRYLLLSVEAGIVLSIIIYQFWKPFLPPSLLYFFTYQWLQVFMIVIYADYKGERIEDFIDTNNTSGFLVMITFMHVAVMALASGVFWKQIKGSYYKLLKAVLQIDTKKVLIAYVVSTIIFPILYGATKSMSSLNQIVLSLAVLRNVFIILLAFILFLKKDKLRGIIIFVLILEFLLGFVSFFSSFKEVVLYVLLAYLTVHPKIKLSLVLKISPLLIVLIFALIFWSYIKPQYREYISGGAVSGQFVYVSKTDALTYLWNHVQTFGKDDINSGTETLIDRVQAMRYYLEVYNRVPLLIPHEQGKNLIGCLNFLLVPRFINADKGILDPSSKLSYYSGKRYMNASEGTSIAMGYLCDFYIDFGVWGMFIPVIIVGLIIGWGITQIMKMKELNTLFMYSLIMGTFLSMPTLENDIIFFLGAIRNFIVIFILGKWIIFPWINKSITRPV